MKKILLVMISGSVFSLSMIFSLFISSVWYLYPVLLFCYCILWRYGKKPVWRFSQLVIGEIGSLAAWQDSLWGGVSAQGAIIAIFLVQMDIPLSYREGLLLLLFISVLTALALVYDHINLAIPVLIILSTAIFGLIYIIIDQYRLRREYGRRI